MKMLKHRDLNEHNHPLYHRYIPNDNAKRIKYTKPNSITEKESAQPTNTNLIRTSVKNFTNTNTKLNHLSYHIHFIRAENSLILEQFT